MKLEIIKILGTIFLSFVLASSALCATHDGEAVLKALGIKLEEARSLPLNARTSYRCPEGLENIVGLPMALVLAALPSPDFRTGSQVSYFLTRPIPKGQRGGGFPEVTFTVSTSNTVERVTCFYSK